MRSRRCSLERQQLPLDRMLVSLQRQHATDLPFTAGRRRRRSVSHPTGRGIRLDCSTGPRGRRPGGRVGGRHRREATVSPSPAGPQPSISACSHSEWALVIGCWFRRSPSQRPPMPSDTRVPSRSSWTAIGGPGTSTPTSSARRSTEAATLRCVCPGGHLRPMRRLRPDRGPVRRARGSPHRGRGRGVGCDVPGPKRRELWGDGNPVVQREQDHHHEWRGSAGHRPRGLGASDPMAGDAGA